MSERPEDVVITDLLDPEYPEEILAAMEMVKPMAAAIEFDLDVFMDQASVDTGLDAFGEPIFEEPMRVWCNALVDAPLSDLGTVSVAGMIVSYLKNRLLAEDLLRRHPEIHDIEVEAPIIIGGLPRTGTTHLHNLISSDTTLRSLPYWESVEPVPPLDEQGRTYDVDPRWTRTNDSLSGMNAVLPYFKRMHDMYADHVHEEIALLGIAGSTMLHETVVEVPAFRDWYLSHDQAPYYEYTKTLLKVLLWFDEQKGLPIRRWILKSPQHLEQFDVLRRVFPDATYVVTHRDPVPITASFATMNTYSARMSRPVDKLKDVGIYWADRIERMLLAAVRDRDLLPAEQSIDVLFSEFMEDDIAMVKRIYELADKPFTTDTDASMAQYMVDHPRGVHGRVLYDMTVFGLDPAERRAAYRPYTDRFPVRLES